MPKFIAINDIHFSLKNPQSRIDDYNQALQTKLNQVFMLAVKIKASAVLIAGDIFNENRTRVHPPLLIYQLLMWCRQLKEAGIRVIVIPGNHDLHNDRYDSLPHQPLGLLLAFGGMEDASFRIITVDGVDIVGIPYPAAKTLPEWESLPHNPSKKSIVLAHCFATPGGGKYFGEQMLAYTDLANLPFDVFHFGHDHRDNGVFRILDKLFINVGALSRGSLSGENVLRDVKCAIIEVGDGTPTKVTQIKINTRPASDVFDLALKAQKDREQTEIENFVTQLDTDLADLDLGGSFKDKLDKLNLPISEAVRKKVIFYIDQAEADTP